MKIDLPLETWTDVFGFLPRSQLVEVSPHIDDRQFVYVLQFFLHKCGQVTLGPINITSSRNGNGPIVVENNRELPLADGPIPPNVVNFEGICLRHYDSSVVVFMQELQRNSLLENVHLIFRNYSDDILVFLTTILPLNTSINSIELFDLFLCRSAYSKLGKLFLKSTRVFETWDCNPVNNDWYCEWLYSPREDSKPRVLVLNVPNYGYRSISLIEHVKKDFLSSKRAISFFIHLYYYAPNVQLELQNEKTGEKLEYKRINENLAFISRHPIGANEEWFEEMNKIPIIEYRIIMIS